MEQTLLGVLICPIHTADVDATQLFRPVARGAPQAIQGIVNTLFWLYCGFNFSESKNQTVATRWQIFRLKYTKFVVGWGSAPDPAGGAYSAPQTP